MTTIQNANPSACLNMEPQRHVDKADGHNPTHASTRMEGGQAVFENDSYRVTAGDDNRVTIHNKQTGESYEAWGDPHMDVDGQRAFDFHGTVSMQLGDGTKVTIATTPDPMNPGATLPSRVTITNGDYGAQISGIDTRRSGDLKIDETQRWGQTLDDVVDDGTQIQENPAGSGFVAVDDNGMVRKVDQDYIDAKEGIKVDDDCGLGHWLQAFKELGNLISLHLKGSLLGQPPANEAPGEPGQEPVYRALGSTSGIDNSTNNRNINITIYNSSHGNNAANDAGASPQAPDTQDNSGQPWWDPLGIGPTQAEQARRKPEDRRRDPLDLF